MQKGTIMKTAFIGMDYIFDIVHPDGKLSRNSSQVLKRSTYLCVIRRMRLSGPVSGPVIEMMLTAHVRCGFLNLQARS
jgi:hypothetical protein